MSLSVLVPDHTGKSVYATPPQSPTEFPVHDPFANPENENGYDPGLKDEQFKSSADAIYHLAQISANGSPPRASPPDIPSKIPQRPPERPAPTVEDDKPSIPPRPVGREIPLVSQSEKEPPQLPARPPSQPERRAPKPTPDLPTRAAPAPFKQRVTLPPPTIPEETREQVRDPALKYSRHPERLVAYLIPLPKPKLTKQLERADELPERYLLYTPPRPHLLKPVKGVKEKKTHWGRRKLQEQVEQAKKYDGKTFSWRGLHSKTTRGVMWAIHRIRATDIVFLGRIENKEVNEIVLVYPNTVTHSIPEVRDEFIAQITRTKRRAAKETAISTFLLPVTLVIDTFAAVFWPFGGLLEIDAVWCYAATRGWYTSRKITKRLGARESRFKQYGSTERDLFLRFHQDPEIEVLQRYVAEACHKKNPDMFDSAGVPPTETDVAKAIGWRPVVRGKAGGMRAEGETGWADEEWQRVVFADDLKAVSERVAISWGHWGKKFEKKPDKALKR
ncbi:hypothetical protein ONS95_006294 [Cadophora gregata]|uniref:uncharacterized protein n=1 Tax=Cadophora gregata TaxID=51156 RepID=UPI0026DCBB75|nr:uncharacterized protein ONS95_006294 [Cadophora gregata]KAK0099345.1 hypothetical protein ONS96_008573 [Cadophora gregata f. sp. sojae]KAK0102693.1 hypothetical protein ONS95_006294 [Cadophora gregata]KAK0104347.1 hypothetical protein ONS96_005432 [Cadophora gregata f. sp. sojae]